MLKGYFTENSHVFAISHDHDTAQKQPVTLRRRTIAPWSGGRRDPENKMRA
jgi:hypothetical protein